MTTRIEHDLLRQLVEAIEATDSKKTAEVVQLYRDLEKGYRDCGDHAEIPLTRGMWSKVSYEDLDRVLNHTWFVVGEGDLTHPFVARAKINGSATPLSRFILELPKGDPRVADHINYDNLDNRRENLRIANKAESATHRRGWHRKDTLVASKFKGVYFKPDAKSGPWRAVIKVDGRPRHLGNFETEERAARAYDRAAKRFHGEFAELNYG